MTEVKNFFKKMKWDSLIISAITIAVGILCIVMPEDSAKILCIIFGCSLIAMGACLLVRFFTFDRLLGEHSLISAIVTITSGVFCLIYPDAVQSILTVLFGLLILVDSISSLADSICCARAGVRGWALLFTMSILTACLGIAVMFLDFNTIMIFAGVALIVEGAKRIITTLLFSHKIREAKKLLSDKSNDIVL